MEGKTAQVMTINLHGKPIVISSAILIAIPVDKFNSCLLGTVVSTINSNAAWQE
jgi:hypothetical protein